MGYHLLSILLSEHQSLYIRKLAERRKRSERKSASPMSKGANPIAGEALRLDNLPQVWSQLPAIRSDMTVVQYSSINNWNRTVSRVGVVCADTFSICTVGQQILFCRHLWGIKQGGLTGQCKVTHVQVAWFRNFHTGVIFGSLSPIEFRAIDRNPADFIIPAMLMMHIVTLSPQTRSHRQITHLLPSSHCVFGRKPRPTQKKERRHNHPCATELIGASLRKMWCVL